MMEAASSRRPFLNTLSSGCPFTWRLCCYYWSTSRSPHESAGGDCGHGCIGCLVLVIFEWILDEPREFSLNFGAHIFAIGEDLVCRRQAHQALFTGQ